jgi:hypothetical protein
MRQESEDSPFSLTTLIKIAGVKSFKISQEKKRCGESANHE